MSGRYIPDREHVWALQADGAGPIGVRTCPGHCQPHTQLWANGKDRSECPIGNSVSYVGHHEKMGCPICRYPEVLTLRHDS